MYVSSSLWWDFWINFNKIYPWIIFWTFFLFFFSYQFIAKNVRRLYGLPPDTENQRRRSVHDVYGRYYAHLAALRAVGTATVTMSLFEYLQSSGVVSRPRRDAETDCLFDRRPKPDASAVALLATAPVNELYPRSDSCQPTYVAVATLYP